VIDMSDVTPTGGDNGADAQAAEPTQAEIDEWAAREKARRQAWLAGPTDEERREYASRIKHRRLSETFDEGTNKLDESVRRGIHYGREGQLAAEGAVSLLYTWSRKKFADLVKAGRDWEEDTALPSRRVRVSFDDDAD
jgi:hypothetical protein